MNSLDTSIKYLAEKGLTVRQVSETRWNVEREGDPPSSLSAREGGFEFSSWMYTPGPGPDDFLVRYSELDATLLAAWCFYFASPIEIAGWQIPLHRRPYWTLNQVQFRLADAVRIELSGFDAIKAQRRERAIAPTGPHIHPFGLRFASETQFVLAGIHKESDERLMIRRDAEEAYVLPSSGGS